jgi:hypothetical protein
MRKRKEKNQLASRLFLYVNADKIVSQDFCVLVSRLKNYKEVKDIRMLKKIILPGNDDDIN